MALSNIASSLTYKKTNYINIVDNFAKGKWENYCFIYVCRSLF